MPERFPRVPISGLGESPNLSRGQPQAQNPLMRALGPAGPQLQAINPIPSTADIAGAGPADLTMMLPLPGLKAGRMARNAAKVKEAKQASRQVKTAEQIFGKRPVREVAERAGLETKRLDNMGSNQVLRSVEDALLRISQDLKGISGRHLTTKGKELQKDKAALALRSKDRVVEGLQEIADGIAAVPFRLDPTTINDHVNRYLTQVSKQIDVPVSKLNVKKDLDRLFGDLVTPSARAKGKRPTPLTRAQELARNQAREQAGEKLSRRSVRPKRERLRLFAR